jgi:hypothetical protein
MGTKKNDPPIEAKPFKLADYTEVVKREAQKFDVAEDKALAIARDVDEKREAALVITETRKESELREVFEEIYDDEVAKRQVCPVTECGAELTSIKQALVHMRTHILFEADWRTIRAVAKDIEIQVFPPIEHETSAAYTAEERTALLKALRERRLLSDSLGDEDDSVIDVE